MLMAWWYITLLIFCFVLKIFIIICVQPYLSNILILMSFLIMFPLPISAVDCDYLMREWGGNLPFYSSPGIDNILYAILKIILWHSGSYTLFLQVLNKALKYDCFLPSWQRSAVTLLPKKGDLTLLKTGILSLFYILMAKPLHI